MVNEGLGSREKQSQSLVTVGQGCQSESVCVTFITAGHWGSFLTFDPSLDRLTPAWPICLAPTAEQRVSLAQAADWWFSSLLLAKCLNLRLSTTGLDRISQQGSTTWPWCADIHLDHPGACEIQIRSSPFSCLWLVKWNVNSYVIHLLACVKYPSMWLSYPLIWIRSRLTSLSAGCVTDVLA